MEPFWKRLWPTFSDPIPEPAKSAPVPTPPPPPVAPRREWYPNTYLIHEPDERVEWPELFDPALQHFPRAFRIGEEGLAGMASYLAECRRLHALPRACLLDARVDGSYGGTGHTAPWDLIIREYQADWPPLILAGGLHPENVSAAIATVKPWGVDVASGVESAPGIKSVPLVQRFIELARDG